MGDTSGRRRTGSLPEERRRAILDQVLSRPMVRADELASQLDVSIETVRRDLLALENEGLTRRVYGGATRPPANLAEPPFDQRIGTNMAAKQAMARLAASLVQPDSMLVLDIGTSVAEVARALPSTFHGRVITNSLLVAMQLAGRDGVELLVAGGTVRGGDLACHGSQADAFFGGFYGGIAFLGSGAVHPQIGLTDHHVDEVKARRIVLDHADARYVLADSTKLGQVAPVKVCDLSQLTGIITDDGADPATVQAFRAAGVSVLIAETASASDPATEARP
jgi:DeoR family fructose operon transcriptional repressor